MAAKIWQIESDNNAIAYTDEKPQCDICGKKKDWVYQIKIDDNPNITNYCALPWNNNCFLLTFADRLGPPDEGTYRYCRLLQYYKKPTPHKKTSKGHIRQPIGLSLRYQVLKRDGFQCVLCGNSGKEAKIEIDHIIPIAKGGKSTEKNLQTLCTKCNRGKSDD